MPALNALNHLVDYAISRDNEICVSVSHGVKKSRDRKKILYDANNQDECYLYIWRVKGTGHDLVGLALIVGDTGPDERVADHTDNEWFQTWWKAFEEENLKALENDLEVSRG